MQFSPPLETKVRSDDGNIHNASLMPSCDFHFRRYRSIAKCVRSCDWSKHSQRTSSIIPELKQSILVARGKRRGERRACACKLYQYLLLLIHSPPVSILVAIEVRYRNSNQFWLLFWSASYKFKRRREIFTPTYLVSCYYLHQILYST